MTKYFSFIASIGFIALCLSCSNHNVQNFVQQSNDDYADTLFIKYSSSIANIENGHIFFEIDGDEINADAFLKYDNLPVITVVDQLKIDSLKCFIYDRDDYDTLQYFPGKTIYWECGAYVIVPAGYEGAIDCDIVMLLKSSYGIDTISVNKWGHAQVNNLIFDDDDERIINFAATIIAQNDSVWSKKNEYCYYNESWHNFNNAMKRSESLK